MLTMIKNTALAASVSLIALSSASAQEEVRVSKIDVEASMSAAQDGNAMDYYPEIVSDIRTAISERVPTSDDAADPEIRVDIRKVSLDGASVLPESREFNELEGVVNITSQSGDTGALSFPIMLAAYSPDHTLPEGYIAVPPSETDFYVALVNAFADRVAEGLGDVNTAGDPISR
ncbi:MAG: hypothetical protein WBB25_02605 [Sulfitobacter sp.]